MLPECLFRLRISFIQTSVASTTYHSVSVVLCTIWKRRGKIGMIQKFHDLDQYFLYRAGIVRLQILLFYIYINYVACSRNGPMSFPFPQLCLITFVPDRVKKCQYLEFRSFSCNNSCQVSNTNRPNCNCSFIMPSSLLIQFATEAKIRNEVKHTLWDPLVYLFCNGLPFFICF